MSTPNSRKLSTSKFIGKINRGVFEPKGRIAKALLVQIKGCVDGNTARHGSSRGTALEQVCGEKARQAGRVVQTENRKLPALEHKPGSANPRAKKAALEAQQLGPVCRRSALHGQVPAGSGGAGPNYSPEERKVHFGLHAGSRQSYRLLQETRF